MKSVEETAGEVKTVKNLKACTEVENLFRFVHENDIRFEGHLAFSRIVEILKQKKPSKRKKKH